jgi:RNA polymerase sigma-70 factor, ECF subfamily
MAGPLSRLLRVSPGGWSQRGTAVPPAAPRGGVVQPLPVAPLNDEALARAVAEGRPGAAPAAWRRFAPLVRRLLRRTLGPEDDIDDHVQEAFLRFFRSARDLRDPALLSSFVVGITMRVARTELRRRRLHRWIRLSETGVLSEASDCTTDPAGREAVRRLYAVLDRVDDRSRVLFVLRHVEGLELAEISQGLGCSLATTKRRLTRAVQRVLTLARREPALIAYLTTMTSGTRSQAPEEGHNG